MTALEREREIGLFNYLPFLRIVPARRLPSLEWNLIFCHYPLLEDNILPIRRFFRYTSYTNCTPEGDLSNIASHWSLSLEGSQGEGLPLGAFQWLFPSSFGKVSTVCAFLSDNAQVFYCSCQGM